MQCNVHALLRCDISSAYVKGALSDAPYHEECAPCALLDVRFTAIIVVLGLLLCCWCVGVVVC